MCMSVGTLCRGRELPDSSVSVRKEKRVYRSTLLIAERPFLVLKKEIPDVDFRDGNSLGWGRHRREEAAEKNFQDEPDGTVKGSKMNTLWFLQSSAIYSMMMDLGRSLNSE